MASVEAFYTKAEDVINQKISDVVQDTTNYQNLDEVYETQRCVDWIVKSEYARVALQFPDELMPDAVTVTNTLQAAVGSQTTVFILGDTSYGSCCVDEVAAQHFNANAVIHFGRSCLSQPCKMPVLFVLGRQPLDVTDCTNQIRILIPDTSTPVILVYDTVYSYACDEIGAVLKKIYPNLVISELSFDQQTTKVQDHQILVQKCGRTFVIPEDKTLQDYVGIFIGKENLSLTNLLYNLQPKEMYSYNPATKIGRKETVNINKLLMKRYFLIEKAKDAKIIGILVGTLGVANYGDVLNRLKQMIKKAGKKSYVFIVGKINVPKLANFMEIDLFVLIACSENTLLDSSDFYKPVITPYEMEVACGVREWTGQYPTEFNTLLAGGPNYVPLPDQIDYDDWDISLVTGKMRHVGHTDDGVELGTTVVLRSEAMSVATQAESAGQFLEMRSWKGLEQHLGETPVTKAVEGQKGIAMGYTDEPGQT